jgi:hypothetical protein
MAFVKESTMNWLKLLNNHRRLMPKLSKHFHPLSRIPKYPNKLHASAWKERQKLSSDSKAFPLATHSAPLSNINSDISVTWRASLRQEDEGRTG